jgi:acyltransferase
MSEIQLNIPTQGQSMIKRVEAIDIFKFFVLFFMIQGHLFRAYLLESIRQSNVFLVHEVLHGIVAPGFLFASGFAAFLSYRNKKEQYITMGKSFFTRIRRILFVIWLGYWIHLPFFSLIKSYKEISKGVVVESIKIDILQCIGISLLVFTLIAILAKKEKVIVALSALAMLLFFALPSVTHTFRMWYIIDPYFDYNVSLFPLFPWAGFLFLGVLAAYFYTILEKDLFFKILLIVGVLLFPWFFFHDKPFFVKAELVFTGVLNKIGGVFLLLWLANWTASRFKSSKTISIMKKAAKESLFVYILHLFIIFNFFSVKGLESVFNNRLTTFEALGVFLVIQAVVFASSLLYNYLKEKKHRMWKILFYIFWGGFFLVFIIRQY